MVSVSGVSCFLLVLLSSIFCAIAQDSICGTLDYHDEVNLSYYMGNFFYNWPGIVHSVSRILPAGCKLQSLPLLVLERY
ncbi:hypothetical protein BU25DRAFT_61170 [Macroventuria anomochaeta]|uniref:Uncharacterized protein n=1 Tax=Macroventuria anomochaeta TaxID=301207 RepID=A0ACB6RZU9_9PLEO|nr:uncharacterized protein BU25DRAFT_61170 [Macroventuria anomochaeta]KAF2627303.1 hypothetical protein BU25DRAFT_61170 [Macroventuria anomochaeta]